MSLVNQALQKVRTQEAQRQVAAGPAMPYQFAAPRRSANGLPLLLIVIMLLTGLLTAAGFVSMSLLKRQRQEPMQLAAPPTPPAPTPAAVAVPAPAALASVPATQPALPAAAVPNTLPAQAAPVVAEAPAIPAPPPIPATEPKPAAQPAPAAPTYPKAAAAAPPPAAPVAMELQSINVPGVGQLKLTGIARSPFGTRAVINGAIVAVGDQLGGATVLDIEDRCVRMSLDGKTVTLKLP